MKTNILSLGQVYSCNEITNHIPRHIYKFGRYPRIRYDNQPHNQERNIQTTTKPEETPKQNQPDQILQQETQPEQIQEEIQTEQLVHPQNNMNNDIETEEIQQQQKAEETQQAKH